MVVRFEGIPCRISYCKHIHGSRNSSGRILVHMTRLWTRESISSKLPSDFSLEEVPVEKKAFTYLFEDQDQCWFLSDGDFVQVSVPMALISKRKAFLQTGTEVTITFLEGHPQHVSFQRMVDARVTFVHSPEQQRSSWKRAVLENGVEILVPLKTESGDMVRVFVDLLQAR
jgi:translation elongation factor P/translation initiation factor 5A